MRIVISGASGLVGSATRARLEKLGHVVGRLVRRKTSREHDVHYDVGAGFIDVEALEGADAVIHLAGENVGDGRWSVDKKQRILESRVRGTNLVASALARCASPPRVLLSASAIGFYGDRGDEVVDEASRRGEGFLAEVCERWEAACQPARDGGIRTVNARIGVVLSSEGGALDKMITPFKLGLGGPIGSGEQWLSWISLDDVVGGLVHLALASELEGPVNVVAPAPARNHVLTTALGRELRRPTAIRLPAFAARLALGERADALLLSSTRARADKLVADGYPFRHPDLDLALRHVLSRERGEAACFGKPQQDPLRRSS